MSYFGNKYAFGSLLALFIQQLLVASSTLFIVLLSEAIIEHKNVILYLCLFILSLIIVYIPGILANYLTEQAKLSAFACFVNDFIQTQKGYASLCNDKDYRKTHEPMLTNEGALIINEIAFLFHDWIALFLNTFLSILALGIIVNSKLILGYLFGGLIFMFIVYLTKNKLQILALEMQNEHKNMTHSLLNGWDNILICNQYNLLLWYQLFKKSWIKNKNALLKYQLWSSGINAIAMIAALIPVFGITIALFISHSNNAIALAVLVVTLPRQIQLIQNVFQIFEYALHWNGVQGKIHGLLHSFALPANLVCDERINWKKISIKTQEDFFQFQSISSLVNHIKKTYKGRLTLSGENGSGKSSILFALKEVFQENAFYVTGATTLRFAESSGDNLSTGQKMMNWLEEVQNEVTQKILLFDELDANFDKPNKEKYSIILDKIAKHALVLEVRHG